MNYVTQVQLQDKKLKVEHLVHTQLTSITKPMMSSGKKEMLQ